MRDTPRLRFFFTDNRSAKPNTTFSLASTPVALHLHADAGCIPEQSSLMRKGTAPTNVSTRFHRRSVILTRQTGSSVSGEQTSIHDHRNVIASPRQITRQLCAFCAATWYRPSCANMPRCCLRRPARLLPQIENPILSYQSPRPQPEPQHGLPQPNFIGGGCYTIMFSRILFSC